MKPSLKRTASWIAVCATFTGGFEGLACNAYPDRLAHGLPTVCYGETEGVHLGDHYTPQECADMLAKKLPRYWSEIERCIHVPVSDNEKIAFTSFSYNVGSGGFCRSSSVHRLNAGDHRGACDGLLAWDHAGSKQVPGLHRRREAERHLCLTPDASEDPTVSVDASPQGPPVVLPATHLRPRASWYARVWRWLLTPQTAPSRGNAA